MSKKTRISKMQDELESLFASREEVRLSVKQMESAYSAGNEITRSIVHQSLEQLYLQQYELEGLIIEMQRRLRNARNWNRRVNHIIDILEKK